MSTTTHTTWGIHERDARHEPSRRQPRLRGHGLGSAELLGDDGARHGTAGHRCRRQPSRPRPGASQQVAGTSGDLCTYEDYAATASNRSTWPARRSGSPSPRRKPTRSGSPRPSRSRTRPPSRGIDLITTNAESDLNKEISDIQGMVDQGVDALIISPLNSEGLDPALDYAKENGVPIMTIDRLLTTKTACKDYIGWIGSDFVEQGERAADAMIGRPVARAAWPSCWVRPAST